MNARRHDDSTGRAIARRGRRPLPGTRALCGWTLLLLLLGGGSAAPARAATLVISSPVTGDLTIGPDDKVVIVTGGSVTGTVTVSCGTLQVNDGSISGLANGEFDACVAVNSGTVKITGGSISGGAGSGIGVKVEGGTVSISGGSISGAYGGVLVEGG